MTVITSGQITLIDVLDGQPGPPGTPGKPGKDGKDANDVVYKSKNILQMSALADNPYIVIDSNAVPYWSRDTQTLVFSPEHGGFINPVSFHNNEKYDRIRTNITEIVKNTPRDKVFTVYARIKLIDFVPGTTNYLVGLHGIGKLKDGTFIQANWKSSNIIDPSNSNKDWIVVRNTFTVDTDNSNIQSFYIGFYFRDFQGTVVISHMWMNYDDVNFEWEPHEKDFDTKLSFKSDQTDIINYINDQKAETIKQALLEFEASESLSQIANWQTEYEEIIKTEDGAKELAEELETKLTEMDTNFTVLEDKAVGWINSEGSYLKLDGNVLTMGGPSKNKILFQEDRISMMSGKNEVMSISQGVIRINNGIFSDSVQTGRFVEQAYESNKDINVVRYVSDKKGGGGE